MDEIKKNINQTPEDYQIIQYQEGTHIVEVRTGKTICHIGGKFAAQVKFKENPNEWFYLTEVFTPEDEIQKFAFKFPSGEMQVINGRFPMFENHKHATEFIHDSHVTYLRSIGVKAAKRDGLKIKRG